MTERMIRRLVLPLLTLTAGSLALPLAASAQDQAKSLGRHNDWSAYRYEENGEPVCFVVSKPERAQLSRSGRDRGDIYFLVTNWTGQGKKGEPSVVIGYPFKDSSTVDVSVGNKSFTMQTSGDGAWLADERDEQELIRAMKAGSRMVVRGTSVSGTQSTDTYSLIGVTAALNNIDKACS